MSQSQSALVVSAHSADFVWRAGGAIASHAKQGWKVKIVCLSYGERGESAKLWRQSGMTLEKVKAARQEEAQRAADILGGEVELCTLSFERSTTFFHVSKIILKSLPARPIRSPSAAKGSYVPFRSKRQLLFSSFFIFHENYT